MSRILVIGGYGGFGARLARRLIAAEHDVLVAGRSRSKAERFCAELPHATPVVADRERGIGMVLARWRPDLVIDAAGPFQASSHAVPEACIAMAIPYLDLADARDFVTAIGSLDRDARQAGIAVIAGASSVPALSGAVCRELSSGFDRVTSVEMALSAASRVIGSRSVAAAILSYAGKPLRMRRGGMDGYGVGLQELRRVRFAVLGSRPLRRWVALADVPDLELLPRRLPGRPAVAFRAGTERRREMWSLWLVSRLVRRGWIRSLRGAERWLVPLQRWTGGRSDGRSAMTVTLKGEVAGQGVERRWTILAERDEGAEIPTFAAAILAEEILAGRVIPGARDAGTLLSLDEFEPHFRTIAVRHEIVERPLTSLYAEIMGGRFGRLPLAVRTMHEVYGDAGAQGVGEVTRGRNHLARLLARLFGMPADGRYPLHVHFAERDGRENWTRQFGPHRFASALSRRGDRLVERFGPASFEFDLPSDESGLRMEFRGWRMFGIPMPRTLGPRIAAGEWEERSRFHFSVNVAAPIIGDVIRYTGWLEPIRDADADRTDQDPVVSDGLQTPLPLAGGAGGGRDCCRIDALCRTL